MNSNATGHAGEIGLYQLRPQYVKGFTKRELYDPEINIMVGVKRLAEVKSRFKNKKNNAFLAAYNCGEAKAKTFRHPELFPYVLEVNKRMEAMR